MRHLVALPSSILLLLSLAAGCGTSDDPPSGPDGGSPIEPKPDASDDPADARSPDRRTPPDAAPMPDIPRKSCDDTDMRMGTGVRSYKSVSDGDTVYLYRGPQGGYMLYLSVQALGFNPSHARFCYTERFAGSGKVFGQGCWDVILRNDLGGGWYERVGIWGQVDSYYWDKPGAIRGEDAIVEGTLLDPSTGCTETRRWSVHISSDPGT